MISKEYNQLIKNLDKEKIIAGLKKQSDTVYIKTYSRFECVKLQTPDNSEILENGILNIKTVSNILYKKNSQDDINYLSEIYILVIDEIKDLKKGLYHYRKDIHAIEFIYDFTISEEELEKLFMYKNNREYKLAFFITGKLDKAESIYGETGYKLALLEAGSTLQFIRSKSEILNINTLIPHFVYDNEIEKLLDIDGVSESLITTIAIK